ncbi:zinc finger protein-like 1 isoform X2 [Tubulanus polymorphus]|uniref:zinc finger protein-like 1 isoform X2 n=1 Tax=Tubulanus polymorphus TaxID=672921 RepID=UPI003DA25600
MGLCKCPKKKVTNLFCFQHRVNVCEHCLVANHSQCIVQSYLRWLQDSDYNPVCLLCNNHLQQDHLPCVRLLCYDIFHWDCINNYAKKLPKNTAPAGYQCPVCKSGLFPSVNQVSPVAESLRTLLSQVNWARAGLGLPLLIDEQENAVDASKEECVSTNDKALLSSDHYVDDSRGFQAVTDDYTPNLSNEFKHSDYVTSPSNNTDCQKQSVAVNIEDVGSSVTSHIGHSELYSNPSRKLFDTTGDDVLRNSNYDHDVDKYKRRPAFHWFAQWFKQNLVSLGSFHRDLMYQA